MRPPEKIANKLIPYREVQLPSGITSTWCRTLEMDQRFDPRGVHKTQTELSTKIDLSEVGPTIFNGSEVLEQTVEGLGARTPLQRLRGTLLTAGNRGIIVFYEAQTTDETVHFVVNLSQIPLPQREAQATLNEFGDLVALSGQTRRLKPEYQDKFRIVEPLACSRASIDGGSFPYFTMPYLPDSQITIRAYPIGPDQNLYGFYYTGPFDDEKAGYWNRKQADDMDKLLKKALGKVEKDPFIVNPGLKIDSMVSESKLMELYLGQRDNFLTAYGLIYLLSNQGFPQEAAISAGDFQGELRKDGLRLALTSLRGGLTGPISEDELLIRLKNQEEKFLGREDFGLNSRFYPLADLSDEYFHDLLTRARELVL